MTTLYEKTIRLASTLPKGSEERRALLSTLLRSGSLSEAMSKVFLAEDSAKKMVRDLTMGERDLDRAWSDAEKAYGKALYASGLSDDEFFDTEEGKRLGAEERKAEEATLEVRGLLKEAEALFESLARFNSKPL